MKQILSDEGLINFSSDGRPLPALAESWTVAPNRLSLVVKIRKNAKFHDGSLVDAPIVAAILKRTLPTWMGAAFEDIEQIAATSGKELTITLRRPSPLLIEALDSPVRKENGSGTGPFKSVDPAKSELIANDDYYLGRPAIDEIVIRRYASIRTAWAEMLRNQIDMLYEVSPDALESLAGANNVSLFTFVRRYQLLVFFNTDIPVFRDATVRRALNLAIDRDNLIAEGLKGHGVPSSGLIWPNYWAFQRPSTISFDLQAADTTLRARRISFVCLVAPEFERVALVVKRQLETVGVDMRLREAPMENLMEALVKRDFDALLADTISGPSLFRIYRAWHSQGSLGGGVGNNHLDSALDLIRFAESDAEYRTAVDEFDKAVTQDPPALFLAWGERARAVSRRFDVPVEPGRDVLTTLRLWRPANDFQYVDRN
ncbi:MAG: ABC transporter substrate-binding protein [Vicinamibacterales bacterium]|nr:ABC transporter substrate-binding protein [Vicinamibacterales bacterium]